MNWNLFEYEKMKEVRKKHPDWIWNRADTHVILGVPGSLEAYKTPVEPGNSFSPGPGTYGVSTWVYTKDKLHAPEEKALEELEWSFERGYLPLLHSDWKAGDIIVSSELFTQEEEGVYKDYLRVTLKNNGEYTEAKLYLVIRSFGAAGGPIHSLKGNKDCVWINGKAMVFAEKEATAFGAVGYEKNQKDISLYLKKGVMPSETEVEDTATWASGALEYKCRLEKGQSITLDFAFLMHGDDDFNQWMTPLASPLELDKRKQRYIETWEKMMSIELDLPDKSFVDGMLCQLAHLYMFTVDNSIRITPVSYPLWWLRDGAYVLNALNKGGFHEFADRACREIAGREAFGGFGSEGDGPSDQIWMLSEHFLLTRDMDFLREVYPHIKRYAELLMKMRRTDRPLRKFTEFVIPLCMLDPNVDLMCLPAKDGLIMGRMDHGIRPFWINGFAYMALKRAAICARALGEEDSVFEQEAEELKKAIWAKVEPEFGKDDRDVNSAFWPAGWARREDELIRTRFHKFWDEVRYPNGEHAPEKEWTYFEAGQAHNFLLLGEREKAWVSIEYFLYKHTAPGLYTYPEAINGNTGLLWPRTRGWDDVECVTPHGWTAAEVFHLLRDCLVREEEGKIVIGSGIPSTWEGEHFRVGNIPTYYGNLSFEYKPEENCLTVFCDKPLEVEVVQELPFEIRLVVESSRKGVCNGYGEV